MEGDDKKKRENRRRNILEGAFVFFLYHKGEKWRFVGKNILIQLTSDIGNNFLGDILMYT